MSRKVVLSLSEHDYEQVELLAHMKKLSVHQMSRLMIQAYIDGQKETALKGQHCCDPPTPPRPTDAQAGLPHPPPQPGRVKTAI